MKRHIRVPIECMAKESSKGVFWVIEDEGKLLAYPFGSIDSSAGIAKSGDTYNHKRLWHDLKPKGSKQAFNYYPRGRVDWDNKGRAIIYLNPNIDDSWLPLIKQKFGIRPSDNVKIQYDYSDHYKCHLDEGWVPER